MLHKLKYIFTTILFFSPFYLNASVMNVSYYVFHEHPETLVAHGWLPEGMPSPELHITTTEEMDGTKKVKVEFGMLDPYGRLGSDLRADTPNEGGPVLRAKEEIVGDLLPDISVASVVEYFKDYKPFHEIDGMVNGDIVRALNRGRVSMAKPEAYHEVPLLLKMEEALIIYFNNRMAVK